MQLFVIIALPFVMWRLVVIREIFDGTRENYYRKGVVIKKMILGVKFFRGAVFYFLFLEFRRIFTLPKLNEAMEMLSGIDQQTGFGFLIDINLGYNDHIETTPTALERPFSISSFNCQNSIAPNKF